MAEELAALPEGEVHLYLARPDDLLAPGRAEAARALLTPDEIARHDRYHFEEGRLLNLATRVLARTVLSRFEPVAPAGWRFVPGPHGRPEIEGHPTALRFNLSNTRGLVVCAVARGAEVGVDVERLDRRAPLDVADRFFARAEVAELRALPPDRQPSRFFDYWTLKESYIKARGLGLALPLGKFAFVISEGQPPRVEIDPSVGDDGSRWQFTQLEPTPEHRVAVCAERSAPGMNPRVVPRWWPLLPGA